METLLFLTVIGLVFQALTPEVTFPMADTKTFINSYLFVGITTLAYSIFLIIVNYPQSWVYFTFFAAFGLSAYFEEKYRIKR